MCASSDLVLGMQVLTILGLAIWKSGGLTNYSSVPDNIFVSHVCTVDIETEKITMKFQTI